MNSREDKTVNKGLNLKRLVFLLMIAAFFLIISSNIYLEKTNLFLGVDGNWKYSVKYSTIQEQYLGRDIFFTYGPLAPYLLPSPVVSDSFLIVLLPELFKLLLFALIFYLIYKFTKYNLKSLFFIIPLSLYLSGGFFTTYTDLTIEIILLLLILNINKNSIKLSNINILFLAFISSLLLLFKFSLGVASSGTIFLLLLFNAWDNKRELVKKMLTFGASFGAFTLFLFYLTAHTINILPYVFNSLALNSLYKEFMAINTQTPSDYMINLILVLGLALNFLILKPKNYLPYIFLSYTAVLYGWVRNDGHILSTNVYILASLVAFVNSAPEKLPFLKKLKAKHVYNAGLFFAGIFLVISYLHFLDYKVDLLKPNFEFNFFKKPVWQTKTAFNETKDDLATLNSSIPPSIKESIQKDSSCLMVIPDKSAIPLALNKCQVPLAYLQLYSNYPDNSDKLNIANMKKDYPNIKILFHDGAIDNRIYLSETPLFMLNIYKNFEIDKLESGFLLLRPRNEKWQDVECLKSEKRASNFLKAQVQYTLYKKIKSLVYKDPELCVEYTDPATGQKMEKRTFRTQLKRGIVTKPFLLNINDLFSYFGKGEEKSLDEFGVKKCGTGQDVAIENIEYFSCH